MFGGVNRTPTWQGTQITWRHGTSKVPRCASCRAVHGKKGFAIGFAILGGVIGTGILPLIGTAIGAGIGYAIGKQIDKARCPKGVKPESAKVEFPSVKELLRQGWQFGEKPNTQ